jgi:hypothetical protein
VLPVRVVASGRSECFRDFLTVLKAHRLRVPEVPAQVAPPVPVVPVLRAKRDK